MSAASFGVRFVGAASRARHEDVAITEARRVEGDATVAAGERRPRRRRTPAGEHGATAGSSRRRCERPLLLRGVRRGPATTVARGHGVVETTGVAVEIPGRSTHGVAGEPVAPAAGTPSSMIVVLGRGWLTTSATTSTTRPRSCTRRPGAPSGRAEQSPSSTVTTPQSPSPPRPRHGHDDRSEAGPPASRRSFARVVRRDVRCWRVVRELSRLLLLGVPGRAGWRERRGRRRRWRGARPRCVRRRRDR